MSFTCTCSGKCNLEVTRANANYSFYYWDGPFATVYNEEVFRGCPHCRQKAAGIKSCILRNQK